MAVRDYMPLNLALMSRWQNWVLIILIVYLAGLAMALLTTLKPTPANEDITNGTDPG